MDLSVVLLEYRSGRPFKIFSNPINFKASSDSVHEALLTFEHFQGTSDSSLRKECHKGAAGSCVRIRQPLPIGKPTRASDPQGIESGAADSDCVCSLGRVESEGFGNSRCDSVRTLRGVVEPCCSNRGDVAQSTLNLIGHGQSSQQVTPCAVAILDCCHDRRQIVAGVKGFPLGQIAVVEIKISHQSTVVEGCPVRSCSTFSDQCATSIAIKLFHLLANKLHRATSNCTDGTTQGIEDTNLELHAGGPGNVIERRLIHKLCELFSVRHIGPFSFDI